MGLTRNGKRIGMAAWAEKRDFRDAIEARKPSLLTDLDHARIELIVAASFLDNMRWMDSKHGGYDAQVADAEKRHAASLERFNELQVNALVTRRDSLLAAMREEAIDQETAFAIIEELAEIETALQSSGYVSVDEYPF